MRGMLNRNNNLAILIAGVLALSIGVGTARFAFTSLLPFMLDDIIDVTRTGLLSSMNYAGYLSGAIFAVFIKDINTKVFYFRIGMILCVITTFMLGTTTDQAIWLVSRVVAGFGTAMALILGSAIVMYKLDFADKTKAMGIHFSGIGLSIFLSDLIVKGTIYLNGTWQNAWIALGVFGLFTVWYCIYILSFDKAVKQEAIKHKFDISIFSFFVIVLTVAYFTEGVGFVVQATFLPDIINSIEGLEGYGGYTWMLVGITAIPSTIMLMRLAHIYGSINIIMIAMLLQVVGILLPTMTSNIYLNLLSGVLYGGTFAGLVALFMHLGGKIAKHNPVVLMGAFTTAYGIGQVSAPLYSAALVEYTGSYDWALYVTAGIVFSGVLLLFFTKKHYRH